MDIYIEENNKGSRNYFGAIVHNKETELHFTYNNISDYKDIINLINTLSTKLSEMIVTLINDGANTPLTYRDKTLKLY